MEELKAFLPIRVTYVCGSDHALRCSLYTLRGGVVVVARPGITPAGRKRLEKYGLLLHVTSFLFKF